MQATYILVVVNILFIFLVYKLQHIGSLPLLLVLLGLAIAMSTGLYYYSKSKQRVVVE